MAACFVLPGKAQQNPMYTQYMFNPYLINPAVSSTYNYYQIRSGHRFQYVGFSGGYPVTNVISVYGPLEKQPMGLGGVIYHDIIGNASAVLGSKFSYSYYYTLTPQYKIAGGISFGFLQYKIDGTEVVYKDDEPLQNQIYSKVRPDANIGFYLWSPIMHIGFSADQILRPKLPFELENDTLSTDVFGRLLTHFYLSGGYKYYINRDYAVDGTLVLKKNGPAPSQLDINVRGIYQKMVWLGFSARTKEGLAVLVGYAHNDRIYIGYSYDIILNELRNHSNGTHEVMIGYKFGAIKN